jgi:predicted GH43/DUF377 family glycosyl hydrolase
MADIAKRFAQNPIISPSDVMPSEAGFEVISAFNPGAFEYMGKIGLVLRIAERPKVTDGFVDSISISLNGKTEVASFRISDPDLTITDTRIFSYKGLDHLTTLSHLRLAWSDDGENFSIQEKPLLVGTSEYESLGIEDSRVTKIDDTYYLTYTAVSHNGYGVGMQSTKDWKTFEKFGVIIPPFNKDATLFPEKISGLYHMLHRPTGSGIGGPYIWSASSPDLRNWGNHKCIAQVRPGMWDSARIGAGSAPIKTDQGWLEIYHGAEELPTGHRYCLGALLLDLDDPTKVIARSIEPIMEPISPYELEGFYGNVVFTNGQVVRGDEVLLYYGAADSYSCGARLSITEILNSLKS